MNISIKLPNDLRGKILTFPFIHALVKEAKKRLNEEEEEILNLHLIASILVLLQSHSLIEINCKSWSIQILGILVVHVWQ